MNDKLRKKNELAEEEFKPSEEQTTVSDLVEAMNILTEIVLGGAEEDG